VLRKLRLLGFAADHQARRDELDRRGPVGMAIHLLMRDVEGLGDVLEATGLDRFGIERRINFE
jgi:hypothetical protein